MQFNSNLIKLFNKTFCKPIHERLLQLHHYTNTFAQYTDAEEKPMNLWTGSKKFQMLYQIWFCLLNRGI